MSIFKNNTNHKLYNPQSPFQWLAFIILMIGIVSGGVIGAVVAFAVATLIYEVDKRGLSKVKKILISIFAIVIGIILYTVIVTFIAVKVTKSLNCSKLKGDKADNCYALMAKEKKDVSLCEKISVKIGGEISSQESCYSNLAEILNDATLCEKIETVQTASGIGTRDTCYYNLALKNNNIGYCMRIEDKQTSFVSPDACYYGVAINTNDVNLCTRINLKSSEDVSIASQDECFAYIGIQTKKPDLCNKAGIFKQDCLDQVK